MFNNPEIKRHYWLDFSFHRLLIMPAVLFIIFLLTYLTATSAGQYTVPSVKNTALSTLAITALTLYSLLIFYWGSYRASGAIVEEINANTWDYQRLSSLSPWSLSWGTILGSTLYVWYGALLCLGVFTIASISLVPLHAIGYTLFAYIISGLACITLVTLIGMQTLQSSRIYKKRRIIGFRILGLFIGSSIYGLLNNIAPFKKELSFLAPAQGFQSNATSAFEYIMYLYGIGLRIDTFILLTITLAFLWSLFGVYRYMRTELKMRTTPWGWTVFLLFICLYCGGISSQSVPIIDEKQVEILNSWYIGSVNMQQFFAIALIISVGSCYMMFFSDNLSITKYRMMFHHFAKGNINKASELIPRWFISYLFAIMAGAVLVYMQPEIKVEKQILPMVIGLLSLLLFLLRDLAILHYFSLAPDNRQAFVATLFYLAILYILIPALFMAAQIKIAGWFYPLVEIVSLEQLIPIIIQILIVGFFLIRRWNRANIETTPNMVAA